MSIFQVGKLRPQMVASTSLLYDIPSLKILHQKIHCFLSFVLGKGPKIKKRESTVFDHTLLTPSPPLTLTMVFLLRILKISTENVQINTIKTGLNKDLVLRDPLSPLDGQRPYFHAFSFLDPSLSRMFSKRAN